MIRQDIDMKIWQKIILVLILVLTITGALTYDAFYSAPSRFNIRHETLSSVYIPEQMDGVTILFFSDLDYNNFMDQERMQKLVNEINELSADIVIFGGDIFDTMARPINVVTLNTVASLLQEIKAPLGKFAVFGDTDRASEQRAANVADVLYRGDFEVLNNTSINLRNTGSGSITLVGLDNGVNGTTDINAAYANVSRSSYVITVCHTPDTADLVPADTTRYFLAGHSHGGQVFWYFDSLYKPKMAEHYFRGRHTVGGTFTVDITNGVGTTIKDVRFLANAEIVLYRLEHLDVNN